MAVGLIDKLTNFLMPMDDVPEKNVKEEAKEAEVNELAALRAKKAHLKVHSSDHSVIRVLVATPQSYDDAPLYADHLKDNTVVLINFTAVDAAVQRSMIDFLNGVCYVINGNVQRVSETILVYTPERVDISKELFAYWVPAYSKAIR